jgi:hypothetical protein
MIGRGLGGRQKNGMMRARPNSLARRIGALAKANAELRQGSQGTEIKHHVTA